MKKDEYEDVVIVIRDRYLEVKDSLNERSRRMFVASEAKSFGHGGRKAAAEATGMAISTIARGMKELDAINSESEEPLDVNRIRREGGGRKPKEQEEGLLDALKEIVESSTCGDPESPLLWTARSQRNISKELEKRGYKACQPIIGRLLNAVG